VKECSSLSLLCPLQSYDRHTDYVNAFKACFVRARMLSYQQQT